MPGLLFLDKPLFNDKYKLAILCFAFLLHSMTKERTLCLNSSIQNKVLAKTTNRKTFPADDNKN